MIFIASHLNADKEDPGLVRGSGVNNSVTLAFSQGMAKGLATDPAMSSRRTPVRSRAMLPTPRCPTVAKASTRTTMRKASS